MSDAIWTDIDVNSLSAAQQAAYETYKDAQRKAAALKAAFEETVTATWPVPTGKRIVFGYRFGKLSAAIVDDERKPSKGKGATTLADFLAAQSASGRSI